MKSSSYWISKLFIDLMKIYIIICISFIAFAAFGYQFTSSLIVLALFPLGVLPFTYVLSFCFTNASVAQTIITIMHFAAILVLSSLVFVMRLTIKLD